MKQPKTVTYTIPKGTSIESIKKANPKLFSEYSTWYEDKDWFKKKTTKDQEVTIAKTVDPKTFNKSWNDQKEYLKAQGAYMPSLLEAVFVFTEHYKKTKEKIWEKELRNGWLRTSDAVGSFGRCLYFDWRGDELGFDYSWTGDPDDRFGSLSAFGSESKLEPRKLDTFDPSGIESRLEAIDIKLSKLSEHLGVR